MNNLFPVGSLVYDVGGHKGESALQFVNGGAGSVISIEPVLSNYLKLVEVSQQAKDIIPIHAAVWKAPGVASIFPSSAADGWSSLQPAKWEQAYPEADWLPPEQVAAITFYQLVDRFGCPQFVKIDVEGSEKEVMETLPSSEELKCVVFEFHNKFRSDAIICMTRLLEMGFKTGYYDSMDVNLDTECKMSLGDMIGQFADADQKWGNVYVKRP